MNSALLHRPNAAPAAEPAHIAPAGRLPLARALRAPARRSGSVPPRIVHILSSTGIGGLERMLLSLLRHTEDSYRAAIVICGTSPLAVWLRTEGHHVVEMQPCRGKQDLEFAVALTRAVRPLQPAILHSHVWQTNFYAAICGRILRVPAVAAFYSCEEVKTVWQRASIRVIARLAKKVVVAGGNQRESLGFRTEDRKLAVIPKAVDCPDIAAPSGSEIRAAVRSELGLDGDDFVVISMGGLHPVTGYLYLLQALALVKPREQLKLLIAGSGPMKGELMAICRALDIDRNVLFLGARDDAPRLLRAADVFVNASFGDTGSIEVLEAMAHGKPVIATAAGSSPELLADGREGMLVPARSAAGLAAALTYVRSNREAAARMGWNARQRFVEAFSAERMARDYRALYDEVLSTGRETS